MDFIFDPSLVLYLPLYELDGASFASRDAYGHLCTVTGALWRPQGRWFDNSDDVIKCGSAASLNDITAKTIILWLYPSGLTQTSRPMTKASLQADGWSALVHHTSKRFQYSQGFATQLGQWVTPDNSLVEDNWQNFAVTYDRSSVDNDPVLYLNGVSQTVTEVNTPSGAVQSDASQALWVGARYNAGSPDKVWSGLIGEVLIYSRLFPPQEVQNIYLATKWRYR